MRYYNSYSGNFEDYRPSNINYGNLHQKDYPSGRHEVRRGRFSTEGFSYSFGGHRPVVLTSMMDDATDADFAFAYMGAYFLQNSRSYDDTANFLLNIIGAWDTGNDFDGDSLFIFEMKLYPVQIEFYINREGRITEIVRYNQDTQDEILIPLDLDGFGFIMCQVYMNFCKVRFGGCNPHSSVIRKGILTGSFGEYRRVENSSFDRLSSDPGVKETLIYSWRDN
jgi:hypothetical protein